MDLAQIQILMILSHPNKEFRFWDRYLYLEHNICCFARFEDTEMLLKHSSKKNSSTLTQTNMNKQLRDYGWLLDPTQ